MKSQRFREQPVASASRATGTGERGFSLIELMISVTMIGIGILSLASLFPLAMNRVNSGDMESRATFHAQGKIEELKREDWATLRNTADADTMDTAFVRNWTVQEDAPAIGMKQIQVTVTWSDSRGQRNVTLSSYLSDSGM